MLNYNELGLMTQEEMEMDFAVATDDESMDVTSSSRGTARAVWGAALAWGLAILCAL